MLSTIRQFVRIVRRHPQTSAFDLLLATLTMAIGIGFALAFDLEQLWSDMPPRERAICDEEFVALGLLFTICAVIFTWRRLLEERQDSARWRHAEQELHHQRSLASADPLTALPNRREFLRVLEGTIARGEGVSVLLLDLNGFKAINDTYGHAVGDSVLKAVASRFRHAARAEDLVARLGGDEFAIVASAVSSAEHALEIGKRFVISLNQGMEVDGKLHHVHAALGTATWPEDGDTAASLIAHADASMYEAKRAMRSDGELVESILRAERRGS